MRSTPWPARAAKRFCESAFNPQYLERAMATFRRYGLLAILIPSILPPPTPFKIFVLAAGVAKVRPLDFILAIAIGRGFRYFGEGLLAVYYGDHAADFLNENAHTWRWSSASRRSCSAWRGSWRNAGANAQPFDDRARKPL